MLVTLIIPFIFMIFMSVSLNRVWGLYNMLQIVSNLVNYKLMSIPANSYYLLFILKNVSNFSIFKDENVQLWLKEHILSRADALREFLVSSDSLILAMIVLLPATVVVVVLFKKYKDSALLANLKAKLMWSSVFRSQIQTYFPASLLTIESLHTWTDSFSLTTLIIKLAILASLPVFSFVFLRQNFTELDEK